MPALLFSTDGGRRLVRTVHTARRLQHDKLPPLDLFNAQGGKVRRLNQLAGRQQLLLNLVELVLGQPHRRKQRLAVLITRLPNHHITAAQVFKVIGEGAECANDGIGIPARLVFDAFTLDSALTQQVIEVDGQLVRHGWPRDDRC